MIKVSGLRKSFRGQAVLRGVDLEVPDGSITIIIGRSGGGKSVFLKHLLGLLHPDSGRIEIDGQPVRAARGVAGAAAGEVRSVALRPEAVLLNGSGGERNRLSGAIEEVSFLGSVVRVRVRFQENAVSLDTFNNPGAPPPKHGDPVTVSFAPEDLLVLEAEAGQVQ